MELLYQRQWSLEELIPQLGIRKFDCRWYINIRKRFKVQNTVADIRVVRKNVEIFGNESEDVRIFS
jgi:hypothetical protein